MHSWLHSWQARQRHWDGGCGDLVVVGSHVLVQSHCIVHPFQHTCEQYGANPCCPHSQLETRFALCMVIQKKRKKNARVPAVRGLRRKSLDFRHVPQPRITRVFQNPRHASTMKQLSDASTGGINFGRARTVLTWRRRHFLRHIFQRRRPVEPW